MTVVQNYKEANRRQEFGLMYSYLFQKGGPTHCGDYPFEVEYQYPEAAIPNINITLCGNPAPQISIKYDEKPIQIRRKIPPPGSHKHFYFYEIQLEQLRQHDCGKRLELLATGFDSNKVELTSPVNVECKYLYNDYKTVSHLLDL